MATSTRLRSFFKLSITACGPESARHVPSLLPKSSSAVGLRCLTRARRCLMSSMRCRKEGFRPPLLLNLRTPCIVSAVDIVCCPISRPYASVLLHTFYKHVQLHVTSFSLLLVILRVAGCSVVHQLCKVSAESTIGKRTVDELVVHNAAVLVDIKPPK